MKFTLPTALVTALILSSTGAAHSGIRGGTDDKTQEEALNNSRNLANGDAPKVLAISGFADGGGMVHRDWPNGGFSSPPGINQFMLNYAKGDNYLASMQYINNKEDLFMGLMDSNADDAFSYKTKGVELPEGTTYKVFSRTADPVQGCFISLLEAAPGKVPILTEFVLYYENFDQHHIDELRVRVLPQYPSYAPRLEVCMTDTLKRDPFKFSVSYALVPESKIRGSWTTGLQTNNNGGTDSYNMWMPTDVAVVPVIQGWWFNFKNNNNHYRLDVINVNLYTGSETMYVNFQDKDLNAPYWWTVDYALLAK